MPLYVYHTLICESSIILTVVYFSKDSFFKSAFQQGIEDNHLHGQYGPDSNVLCFYSYTV